MEWERKKTGVFRSVSQPANNGSLDKFQILEEFRQAQSKTGEVCGQTVAVGSLQKHLPGWHNKAQSVKMGYQGHYACAGESPSSLLSVVNIVSECDFKT